ncbi:THAP domain-containing protein 5-like isoform X2 [Neocloeon triangulifer]|uniref:THAP domain-containing protein 5-like isoform X2 n=1 Tax=Neocloeon triangulifer TaxID=2078957 RepID=UPI00286FA54D|nr:THAP domain-containing protein 5-like isoform X2 [Neocloeon triangulifer]
MVISCSVPTCRNRFVKGGFIQFHSFPMKREDMCRKWADAIGRLDWFPTKNSFVCSEHFLPEDYQTKPGKLKHFLKEGVVPSIFNPTARRGRPMMPMSDASPMKVPFVSPQQIQMSYANEGPDLSEIISPNITVTRSPSKLEALLPGGVSIVPVKKKSLKRDSRSPILYEEPRKMAKLSLPNALNGSVVITTSNGKPVPKLRPILPPSNGHSSNDEYDEPLDVSQFLSISMQPEDERVKVKSESMVVTAVPQDLQQRISPSVESLQRRNAALHAELKKRDGIIKDLRLRLSALNNNVDSTVIEFLKRYFDNTAFQIIDNHIRNKKANSYALDCYSEVIMKFAANLYKSSPRAYLLVRQHLDLPPPTYLHKCNLVPELNGEQAELSSGSNEYYEDDIYQETAVPEHLPEKNDLPPQSISDKNIKDFRQFNIIMEHD